MNKNELFIDYDQFYVERPFDFTLHASIGCGGVAKTAIYPRNEGEALALFNQFNERGVDWVVLGNLTNVLPSDLGTDKVVVCTKKLTKISLKDKERIYVEAGVTSGVLLAKLREYGLSGAEFLIGIPCTMGGALYMNAGAGGRYICEIVESVRVIRDGRLLDLSITACAYSYKHSLFMHTRDMIVGVMLKLKRKDKISIQKEERYWKAKRMHLPKGKSMGCIFKNPENLSAGALIEKAGLKGLRIGGAKVSEIHANFIINDGNATAREIHTLIKLIQNAVFAYSGVMLEEEIQYVT